MAQRRDLAAEHPGMARLPAPGAVPGALPRGAGSRAQRRRGGRDRGALARRGSAAPSTCSGWSSRPASAADSSSVAAWSTVRAATPATSVTSSWTLSPRRACAAGSGASRRSPAGRLWRSGPTNTVGVRTALRRSGPDEISGRTRGSDTRWRSPRSPGPAVRSGSRSPRRSRCATSRSSRSAVASPRWATCSSRRCRRRSTGTPDSRSRSDVRVVPAALGQDAGIVGAAALIHQGERYWSAD